MKLHDDLEKTVYGFLAFAFRALRDGPPHHPIAACLLYEDNYGHHPPRTEEEIQAIIRAVERLNQRWLGMFVPIWPPTPQPDDRLQTIRILDSFAFWDVLQSTDALQTEVKVALGRTE